MTWALIFCMMMMIFWPKNWYGKQSYIPCSIVESKYTYIKETVSRDFWSCFFHQTASSSTYGINDDFKFCEIFAEIFDYEIDSPVYRFSLFQRFSSLERILCSYLHLCKYLCINFCFHENMLRIFCSFLSSMFLNFCKIFANFSIFVYIFCVMKNNFHNFKYILHITHQKFACYTCMDKFSLSYNLIFHL